MIEKFKNIDPLGDRLDSVPRRKVLVGLAVLVILGAVAIFVSVSEAPQIADEADVTGPEETSENTGEEVTQNVGLSASQIEGDIIEVSVDREGAEPVEALIAPEDGIRFVNRAGLDLEFEFDRNIQTFQVSAGEDIIVNPESIVYYTVNPVDDSIEFREISARINVQ